MSMLKVGKCTSSVEVTSAEVVYQAYSFNKTQTAKVLRIARNTLSHILDNKTQNVVLISRDVKTNEVVKLTLLTTTR